MGFIFDAAAIFLGGIIGSIFRKKLKLVNNSTLAIGIMLISAVGLLENILSIADNKVVGEHTVIVTIALVVGCAIGDALRLEDKIYSLPNTDSVAKNGFIDSVLFFGIGGLQISGPIIYALEGNDFQLILKGVIDLPFALMLGASYGMVVSLSAFPVVFVQIAIALIAYCLGNFISGDLLCQLCSLGYLILFFSGFNMIATPKNRIKNINIIPGILLIILYNVLLEVVFR